MEVHLVSTYWSCAQKNNRETTAEGLGWELFKNYLIAKEKFKPDFFLYENNKSAAQAIKDQIKHELGVWDGTFLMRDTGARYIEINSALVSAQNRQRFYVHNCGEVGQPEDRGILLKDILESGVVVDKDKSYCLKHQAGNTRDYFKKHHTQIAYEPVNVCRNGKSQTIKAQYGFTSVQNICCYTSTFGASGVAIPATEQDKEKRKNAKNAIEKVYEVKNGLITIKGKQYPIKLPDGYYIIRKLTVTECERLQTLPDGYTQNAGVSETQCYKGIGNGWSAEVIIHILSNALKNVPKDEKIIVLSMYDGIGTGRYCLDKMGFTNVEYHAYEIDKYAMKIALSNYPDIIQHGDAFQVRGEEWNITTDLE